MCLAYYPFTGCHRFLCMTGCSSGDLLNARFRVRARPRMHTVNELRRLEAFAEQPVQGYFAWGFSMDRSTPYGRQPEENGVAPTPFIERSRSSL